MGKTTINSEVEDHVGEIIKGMEIAEGSNLARIVDNFTRKLIEIASNQYDGLVRIRKLTGIRLSKINIDDIKQIDPGQYEDPGSVAKAMDSVLKVEAEKLLSTSDFITAIRNNLGDCLPTTRASFDAANSANPKIVPLKMARTIAGQCIKGGVRIFSMHNPDGLNLSISHMPSIYLKNDVQRIVDRIKPYLS